MIFALVLLYQTATVGAAAVPPKADTAQVQTKTAADAEDKKPPEKPDMVCKKEFPTGTRVRTVMVCTSKKSMERNQADLSRSLNSGSLAPIP